MKTPTLQEQIEQLQRLVLLQQQGNPGGVVTIQKTSKSIKGRWLFGLIMIFVGIILIFNDSGWGLLMLLVGMIYMIVARCQRWWNHS